MKNTRGSFARRTATAAAFVAVLLPLAACDEDADADAGGTAKPSQSAPAQTDAQPNGVEKLSGKEIYNKGMRTNAEAGSFHEKMSRKDAKTDVKISATECVGTVEQIGHGSFQVIRKGNDVWAKVDAAFAGWAQENGSSVPADKWMHGTPENEVMQALSSFCHHEQFTKPDTASVDMAKGQVATVDGVSVVPVSVKGNGNAATYYFATTGKPYLLKRDSTADSPESPDIEYSEFGTPVGAKAPSGVIVEAPKS